MGYIFHVISKLFSRCFQVIFRRRREPSTILHIYMEISLCSSYFQVISKLFWNYVQIIFSGNREPNKILHIHMEIYHYVHVISKLFSAAGVNLAKYCTFHMEIPLYLSSFYFQLISSLFSNWNLFSSCFQWKAWNRPESELFSFCFKDFLLEVWVECMSDLWHCWNPLYLSQGSGNFQNFQVRFLDDDNKLGKWCSIGRFPTHQKCIKNSPAISKLFPRPQSEYPKPRLL